MAVVRSHQFYAMYQIYFQRLEPMEWKEPPNLNTLTIATEETMFHDMSSHALKHDTYIDFLVT